MQGLAGACVDGPWGGIAVFDGVVEGVGDVVGFFGGRVVCLLEVDGFAGVVEAALVTAEEAVVDVDTVVKGKGGSLVAVLGLVGIEAEDAQCAARGQSRVGGKVKIDTFTDAPAREVDGRVTSVVDFYEFEVVDVGLGVGELRVGEDFSDEHVPVAWRGVGLAGRACGLWYEGGGGVTVGFASETDAIEGSTELDVVAEGQWTGVADCALEEVDVVALGAVE